MKTLQIGLEWFPEGGGGLDRVYYDCIRYLPTVGVDVKGLVAGSPKVWQDSNQRIQPFATPQASLLQRWRGIQQATCSLLSEQEYTLVASHFALYTFPILNQLSSLPLVIHFHGPWSLESRVEGSSTFSTWCKKTIEQITYRQATEFIVLSRYFEQVLHSHYHIPREKIHVIPGGVEMKRFNLSLSLLEARKKLLWSENRPIIFCVRRLVKRMGLENLIAAINKVKKYCPDVLLYIAGKGALAETLQKQINDLDLTNHVILLGYLPDEQLPLAYRAANFSVVPTLSFEGFGLIVIESLAAGTPVLATPVGGIPEILRPLSSDLLLTDSSIEQLAQGIVESLRGQRQMPTAQTCQRYVQENYTWEVIAPQIKSVYEKNLATFN